MFHATSANVELGEKIKIDDRVNSVLFTL